MARIRTIKPEFFKHEQLFDAEMEFNLPLRLAFSGLWCCADREGRFKWRPRQLKIDILPYDEVDFSRVLDALATRGFIVKYSSDSGEEFGFIPSFPKHQVINNRESQSLLPDPSFSIRINIFDASSTREPREDHAGKGERKGKEGKGREGVMREDEESLFTQFWTAYPNKTGKGAAEKAWSKIKRPSETLALILAAIERQKQSIQWKKDNGQFIPNPSTWLNQRRWEDGDDNMENKTPEQVQIEFMRRMTLGEGA